MISQLILALYLLLVVCVAALVSNIREPLDWSWSTLLQIVATIFVALIGITINAATVICVILGWFLFVVFFVMPALMVGKLHGSIPTLNATKARDSARLIPYFYWGKRGHFWEDVANAAALYMEDKKPEADALLDKWNLDTTPSYFRETLADYKNIGNSIAWNWAGIIENFEHLKETKKKISKNAYLSTSRAYAEMGEIDKAAKLLLEADLGNMRTEIRALAAALIPFFCSANAREKVEKLLALTSTSNGFMPSYMQNYWLGRLALIEGDTTTAKSCFEKSLSGLPESSMRWRKRLESWMNREPAEPRILSEETKNAVEKIWEIFDQCAYNQSVVAPRRGSTTVGALVVIILLTYLISDAYTFYPNSFTAELKNYTYQYGMLKPDRLLAGEYWRLISYLFLHQHVAHVLLNVLGLYWFGRIAENIYGTPRFLAIYFVSGALSGVVHSLLQTTPAIGASGAVMGIFGSVAAGIFRLKDRIPETLRRSELYWMAGLAVAQVVLDQIIPHVAAFAHLGGMVAGFLLGLLLGIPKRGRPI